MYCESVLPSFLLKRLVLFLFSATSCWNFKISLIDPIYLVVTYNFLHQNSNTLSFKELLEIAYKKYWNAVVDILPNWI